MSSIAKVGGVTGKKKHGSSGRSHKRNHRRSTNVGKKKK